MFANQRGRALLGAIKADNVGKVRTLLAKPGVNIHYKNMEENDDNRIDVITLAGRKGNPEIIRTLIEYNPAIKDQLLSTYDKDGYTPLIKAAKNNKIEDVQKLLAIPDIDVNYPDQNWRSTALMFTAKAGHIDIVRMLLAFPGVDVNHLQIHKNTALMFAAMNGHTEIVRMLLAIPGIDVNMVNNNVQSALSYATQYNHTEVVRMLMAIPGINVNNVTNPGGDTALIYAASNGNTEIVNMLLAIPDIDINHRTYWGSTALLFASEKGHTEIVRILLAAPGINVNQINNHGYNALIFAVASDYIEIVRMLLAVPGININNTDNKGNIALFWAVQKGYIEIVQMLLDTPGIDINHANMDGNTGLILAAQYGHTEIVRMLLAAPGIDVNHANNNRDTALIWAIDRGHTEIARMLLAVNGIDINHANNTGITALQHAADKGNTEIVRALLAIPGINVNYQGIGRDTPLLTAVKNGNIEIFNALMAVPGIDVNHANINGITALISAANHKHVGIVRTLLAVPGIDVNAVANTGETSLQRALNLKTPIILIIVQALLEKNADPRIGKEPTPYTNALNRVYPPEINKMIRNSVPIPPEMRWKGYTRGDVTMLNDVFLNPEEARATSFCPVCLAVVKHNMGCMYMSHICPGLGRTYDIKLYNKYKSPANTIYWCTVCGRICNHSHDHYRLGPADGPKPTLITDKHGSLFDPDCRGQGGGGFEEKLKRMHRLREAAIGLNREIGRITKQEAQIELVEAAWDAPLSAMTGVIGRAQNRQRFNIPDSNFPPNVANNNMGAPSVPYPNAANPALFPVVHAEGYDHVAMEDVPNAVQFRHRKADGTINNHEDTYIGIDTLFRNIFSDDKPFGMCWNYAGGCTARIYPQELASILTSAVGLTPEKRAEYQAILNSYSNRFDRHMAAAVVGGKRKTYKRRKQRGGESDSMFPIATDAVCSLPTPNTRRTYRKKPRKGTKRR